MQPVDGIYWIRSITKDRYLDVAYEKTEDNAQIIGQTLNPAPTTNQQVCYWWQAYLLTADHFLTVVCQEGLHGSLHTWKAASAMAYFPGLRLGQASVCEGWW